MPTYIHKKCIETGKHSLLRKPMLMLLYTRIYLIFLNFLLDTKVIYHWNKEKYRFQNIKKMIIIRFYFQNALKYYTLFFFKNLLSLMFDGSVSIATKRIAT